MFTGNPQDIVQNTFHFLCDVPVVQTTAVQIATRMTAFYQTAYGGPSSRVSYLDWALAHVRVFALAEPPPRVPYVAPLTITAGTGTSSVPTEVACVLSFHAAPESGVRFQRLYNRVFLGGIITGAMQASAVDAFPTFASTFITQVRTAAIGLADANTTGIEWVQVSNAGGLTAVRPIVGGWVDNSPDTQRRRSVLATSRNNWAPTP